MHSFPVSCVAAAGCFALAVPAMGVLVIDDFSQPGGTFPLVSEAIDSQASASTEGAIGGGAIARSILQFASFDGPAVGAEGREPVGTLTTGLDTAAGALTVTATGDVLPTFVLAYGASGDQPLDLDVSGEEGLLIEYETNLAFDLDVSLTNTDASGTIVAGNQNIARLTPGGGPLFLAFEEFTGVLMGQRFNSQPPFVERFDLPGLDTSSLDGVGFLTNAAQASDNRLIPAGLQFSVGRVAFVPEPASAALVLLGGAALLSRRRMA